MNSYFGVITWYERYNFIKQHFSSTTKILLYNKLIENLFPYF